MEKTKRPSKILARLGRFKIFCRANGAFATIRPRASRIGEATESDDAFALSNAKPKPSSGKANSIGFLSAPCTPRRCARLSAACNSGGHRLN